MKRRVYSVLLIIALMVGFVTVDTAYGSDGDTLEQEELIELEQMYVEALHAMVDEGKTREGDGQSIDEWVQMVSEGEEEWEEVYTTSDRYYNITGKVVHAMNKWYNADRGEMQVYFDRLNEAQKTNINFYEAVLEYIGAEEDTISGFYSAYDRIMIDKREDESVTDISSGGRPYIKDKFKKILNNNGIKRYRELDVLAFNINICGLESLGGELPYRIGYKSRENMMLAAMSLVGEVRYVWGGGHLTTGNIRGISPAWKAFFDTYGTEKGQEGYSKCIKTKDTWCPVHGRYASRSVCALLGDYVYSLDNYIKARKNVMNTENLNNSDFRNMINSTVDFSKGVAAHRFDGLDCSGYTSWLYNQIDLDNDYDAVAIDFIRHKNLKTVKLGSRLLPGDVFSWGPHIVVIVGQLKKGSNAYVTTEATPNMIKFGVVHYGNATSDEIKEAVNVAAEANRLIGGVPKGEDPHIYNMDRVGYRKEGGRYAEVGRLAEKFLDEDKEIPQYEKCITDMYAVEIIQNTIDKLPDKHIKGKEDYNGKLFSLGDGES